MEAEKFLTVDELADRWKIKPETIRNWMVQGKAPSYLRINGAIRFSIVDIEIFEKEKRNNE